MTSEKSYTDTFRLITKLLTRQERFKLIALISALIGINALDIIGLGLLGLVGAIAISGIQSSEASSFTSGYLNFFQIEDYEFQLQVAILATVATILLTLKTFMSLYLSKKTLFFFAHKSAKLSGKILTKIFDDGLQKVKDKSIQQIIYTSTSGCDILMIGAVAQSVNLVSDLALLLIIGAGILIIQPATAIVAFVIFGTSALIMHKVFNTRAKALGKIGAQQGILVGHQIQNLFTSYREVFVSNNQKFYIEEIKRNRQLASKTQAEANYLPALNKYFLETTLIIGSLGVAALQFVIQDAKSAILGLAVFLAAGSRLVPSLIRVQQGSLNIRNSLGGASETLTQLSNLDSDQVKVESELSISEDTFVPEILIKDLNFKYTNGDDVILKDLDLRIELNTMFALTGPSGSGKTTLVDVILGIFQPTSGLVFISGEEPRFALKKWPGAISYVPQEVFINSGSFISNIATGMPERDIDREQVLRVCAVAQLSEVIKNLPDGLETVIGTPGISLSGGQKQRIGLARALYSNPDLIVLDEPTSSLDMDTERLIADSLNEIKKSVTIILIAHRLSTLSSADQICYLEDGQILALGTLSEVRDLVPNFDANFRMEI